MDAAHKWTDKQIAALERKLTVAYAEASKEMGQKLKAFMADYARERSQRLKALDDTAEAKEAFEAWCRSKTLDSQWMYGMTTELAKDAVSADVRAMEAVNAELPRVYAENANYAAYRVDKAAGIDTSFTLLNEDAVRHLAQENVQLLPKPAVDIPKDLIWNKRKMTSALTQGIMQGESVPKIAKRLMSVTDMDRRAAIRNARTACTAAENAGRVASYERAEEIGIELQQMWVATLDGRTRFSHRQLDGETVPVGESFDTENGPVRYPGDPMADPAEVYNCRCNLREVLKSVDYSARQRFSRLPDDVTYDDWKAGTYQTDKNHRETASSLRARKEGEQ